MMVVIMNGSNNDGSNNDGSNNNSNNDDVNLVILKHVIYYGLYIF